MVDVAAMRKEALQAREHGNKWYEKIVSELKEKNVEPGTFVGIEVSSGRYVLAKTRIELIKTYEKQFGDTTCWIKRYQ